MAIFIVRFLGRALDSFQGRVRHVRTGEEASFSDPAELAAFMMEMNGTGDFSAMSAEDTDRRDATVVRRQALKDAGERSKTGRRGRGGRPVPEP